VRRGPRRTRANCWSWLYLALFGSGEDDAGDGNDRDAPDASDGTVE
jgi:hypothetical protein